MGVESALLGSIVTSIGGLLGIVMSKLRCVYRHDDSGCCAAGTACGFSDKPLNDHHEIEIFEHSIDATPVLIITKKVNSYNII